MEIKVFHQQDEDNYTSLLKKYNLNLDIYYSLGFLNIEASYQGGIAEIYTVFDENNIFIYPYIRVRLSIPGFENYSDLTSPYGYCGPYVNNASFLKIGEEAFIEYVQQQNVVSEFVRYHFLYNKDIFFTIGIENLINRTLILTELNHSWDEIFMTQFSRDCRNLVRKMEKENFQYTISSSPQNLDHFLQLYYKTMDKVKAEDIYYFPESYIKGLFSNLKNQIYYAEVTRDSEVYSAGLFFASGGIVNYYLSSRNLKHSQFPSTNYLLSSTIKYFATNGMSFFNLGGGLSNKPEDTLFRFKKLFSKKQLFFYIGKRIHNRNAYSQLTEQYIQRKGKEHYESKKHFLQFYRM